MRGPACGRGLKSNQNAVVYPCNSHATIAAWHMTPGSSVLAHAQGSACCAWLALTLASSSVFFWTTSIVCSFWVTRKKTAFSWLGYPNQDMLLEVKPVCKLEGFMAWEQATFLHHGVSAMCQLPFMLPQTKTEGTKKKPKVTFMWEMSVFTI